MSAGRHTGTVYRVTLGGRVVGYVAASKLGGGCTVAAETASRALLGFRRPTSGEITAWGVELDNDEAVARIAVESTWAEGNGAEHALERVGSFEFEEEPA